MAPIEAIGFNMENFAEPLLQKPVHHPVDIAYTLEENTVEQPDSVQLRLKDIQIDGYLSHVPDSSEKKEYETVLSK
jgi:hypothetical protein